MRCSLCHAENRDDSKFCGNCAAPLGTQAHAGLGPEADSLTKTLETPVRVLKPGALIAGKYRIIEEVGAGGMGVVYKAEDLKLKRCVALKFLPPHLLDSPELKERFLVEAQAAAALSHPNICTIYEVGEDKSCPYIAMEYVEGETLRDRVRKGPLKTEEAVDIILQVAAGLGEAHGKGIIHRDIKSANIMVTPTGRAKVMDFGLAKLRGGSSLTKSQTTLGTVAYMSPEQARGDKLDQRTDIWSLGIVLYELLSGKLPFQGDHDQTVIYSIIHKEPESLVKIRPALTPELDHVVGQALTKKAADRYQTMEELREDLAAIAGGFKPFRARPAGRTVLGLRVSYVYPALAALLALALGLNVGGVRDRLMGRSDSPPLSHEPEKSIAVLPFINDSPDQENTYFINGVMEEILNNLQRIKSLRVISRTSVEQYRERKKSIREIAEELGVNYIVDGSAQQYGNNFRLRTQLIMAAGETQLWGESFQQKITNVEDIFDIQTQIAESIAAELRAVISPEEKQLIEKYPLQIL
jgi:serine/threonine protein kinase